MIIYDSLIYLLTLISNIFIIKVRVGLLDAKKQWDELRI